MANIQALKKDELVELAKGQEEKINELETMKLEFQKQLDEMKAMMLMQMKAQTAPLEKVVESKLDRDVYLVSYMYGKQNISVDKEVSIHFSDFGDSQPVSYTDAKLILKNQANRNLFLMGALVFEDKEDYSEFKIKHNTLLTEEFIVSLYNMNYQTYIETVKNVTENKTLGTAVHTIIYISAKLFKLGKIKNINADTMNAFKDFFGKTIMDVQLYDE